MSSGRGQRTLRSSPSTSASVAGRTPQANALREEEEQAPHGWGALWLPFPVSHGGREGTLSSAWPPSTPHSSAGEH